MKQKPSSALLDAIEASPTPIPSDKLIELRDVVREARSLGLEVLDLEDRLSSAKKYYNRLTHEVIPTMMDELGVPSMSLSAYGNEPAVDVEVRTSVSANIAASWDRDRREAALRWLDDHGHGDLIKTTLTVRFPRNQRDRALDVMDRLAKNGLPVEIAETVHGQTLSAWLREALKKGLSVPLDVIGGVILRAASIKQKGE